jgi:hypothetical protein
MKRILIVLMLATLTATAAESQTAADSAAIRAAALDYAEGWYEGNAERMERAVHPELAKRIVRTPRGGGGSSLDHMTAATLVEAAGAGSGRNTPPARQIKEVRILDVFGGTASVRTEMDGWVDYMHMARWNGEWRIVNVLWELKPRS